MKNKSILITIFTIICIVLVIFALQRWNTSSDALSLTNENSSTTIPLERTWTSEPLVEISLHSDLRDSLFRAVKIDSFDGTLYVVDYGDMIIKRFTLNGNFIDKIGKGVGRGPGEFSGILDLDKYQDTLYVLDRDNHVSLFDINSKGHLKDFKTNAFPGGLLVFSDHIVVKSMIDYKFFTIYDRSDSVVTYFGGFAEGKQVNIMSYGGYLVPSNKFNEFNYVTRFGSYLNFYNTKGDSIRIVETIDRLKIPPPQRLSTGIRVPSVSQLVDDVAFSNSFLFLNNTRAAIKDHSHEEFQDLHSFIDIYSLSGEKYFESIPLPFYTNRITVVGGYLFAKNGTDDLIHKFELPENYRN